MLLVATSNFIKTIQGRPINGVMESLRRGLTLQYLTSNIFTDHINSHREQTHQFKSQINPLILSTTTTTIYRSNSSHKTLIPFSATTVSGTKFKASASSNSNSTLTTTPTTITMVKAIRVHELGGAEVLKWGDVEVGEPKEGEIRVRNKAIGLNFIDIYFRKGVYKAPTMPFTPGMEAVGEVVAVGPGLTGRKVGDLVAYAGNPMGAYAEEQVLPADRAVPVPPSVDPITAASVMLKGMTVHYLVRRSFKVEAGHTVLVHAAAGGVGSLLCQWANALGATVIGTVSKKEKALQAIEDGCHHVIIYKEEDFVSRVQEITAGQGVEVVYDSVGKDTFQGSLDCLKFRGYMILYGQSSGTVDHVPLSALAVKSLFITRPTLMHYTMTRDELLEAAGELFANVASGVLRVRVNHKFLLSQAAEAQTALENRQTTGSVVLIPDASL